MPIVGNKVYAPVDFKRDIAIILGSSSGDEGTLCKHTAINKWAKYKPVRKNTPTPVNDAYLGSIDYGFDMTSQSGSFASGGWSEVVAMMSRALSVNAEWIYLPPRGKSYGEYFRIMDFTNPANPTTSPGYNANANAPFTPVSRSLVLSQGGELSIGAIGHSDAEIPIQLFHSLIEGDTEHDFDDYNLGVITRRGNTTKLFISNNPIYMMLNGEQPESAVRINLDNNDGLTKCLFVGTTIPSSAFQNGVYDGVTDIDSECTFWLPGCLENITVDSLANAILLSGGSDYFFRIHTLSDGTQMQNIMAQVLLTNRTSAAQSVTVTVDLQYYDHQGGILGSDSIIRTISVPYNGSTGNMTLPQSVPLDFPSSISQEESYGLSNIGVKVKWQWNPTGYTTETRYFDFLNGYPITNDPGFELLSNVANNETVEVISDL